MFFILEKTKIEPMTDSKTKKVFAKAGINFITSVALGSLFFFTLLEGIITQLQENHSLALTYYLLAFLTGITAVYNYLRAKTLFNYAKLS